MNNFHKVCLRLQKIGTLNTFLGVGKDSQNRDALQNVTLKERYKRMV